MNLSDSGAADPVSLVEALNEAVLAVAGVSELYPPQNALHSAADQVVAFVRGNNAPPVRTVAIEKLDDGLKVSVRVGIEAEHGTPTVVSAVATAIRNFVSTEINDEIRCHVSVQAVSIQ